MSLSAARYAATLLVLVCAPVAQGQRSFRLLEWNVSDSDWVKHIDDTRAVLRHANADVFVLAQVAAGMDSAAVRQVLHGLRGPSDTSWFLSMIPSGAAMEHTVIASRDSVRPIAEMANAAYSDTGALAGLAARAAVPRTGERVAARDTVNVVHMNGAMVRAAGQWVLVAGVHLMCCGTPTDWREARRQLAAVVIRDRTRAAFARRRPRGIIVAGDMNLVAGAGALDTLLGTLRSGPPGPMRRADALQPDGWTDWTWDGRGTPFNGGRLDNVLYSSQTLTPVRAFVWDTEFMPADTLRAHGLEAGTSKTINRHRPVVVDFRLER